MEKAPASAENGDERRLVRGPVLSPPYGWEKRRELAESIPGFVTDLYDQLELDSSEELTSIDKLMGEMQRRRLGHLGMPPTPTRGGHDDKR